MPEPRYLRVRNFEKFQSFNSKNLKQNPNPLWIKVYYALLADRMFFRLPDAQKFHVIGMFMIASQCDNKIPSDMDWLQHQMGATTKLDLAVLLKSRFIEWIEPDGPATPTLPEITTKAKTELHDVTPLDSRESILGTNQSREEESREEEKRVEGKGTGETTLRVPAEPDVKTTVTDSDPRDRGTSRRRTTAPDTLPISDSMAQWARENGITVDLIAETAAMLDHHRGLGNLHLDWVATWRTWMRKTKKWGSSDGRRPERSKADINRENAARVLGLADFKTRGSGECNG